MSVSTDAIPPGYAPHSRRSPVTEPWEPIYSKAVGVIFIGRRSIPDPLSSTESVKSVIEFQGKSGGRQTFVDCSFKADVGLNLCMTDSGLAIRNQAVAESGRA